MEQSSKDSAVICRAMVHDLLQAEEEQRWEAAAVRVLLLLCNQWSEVRRSTARILKEMCGKLPSPGASDLVSRCLCQLRYHRNADWRALHGCIQGLLALHTAPLDDATRDEIVHTMQALLEHDQHSVRSEAAQLLARLVSECDAFSMAREAELLAQEDVEAGTELHSFQLSSVQAMVAAMLQAPRLLEARTQEAMLHCAATCLAHPSSTVRQAGSQTLVVLTKLPVERTAHILDLARSLAVPCPYSDPTSQVQLLVVEGLRLPRGWQHVEGCLMVAELIMRRLVLDLLCGSLQAQDVSSTTHCFVQETQLLVRKWTNTDSFEVRRMVLHMLCPLAWAMLLLYSSSLWHPLADALDSLLEKDSTTVQETRSSCLCTMVLVREACSLAQYLSEAHELIHAPSEARMWRWGLRCTSSQGVDEGNGRSAVMQAARDGLQNTRTIQYLLRCAWDARAAALAMLPTLTRAAYALVLHKLLAADALETLLVTHAFACESQEALRCEFVRGHTGLHLAVAMYMAICWTSESHTPSPQSASVLPSAVLVSELSGAQELRKVWAEQCDMQGNEKHLAVLEALLAVDDIRAPIASAMALHTHGASCLSTDSALDTRSWRTRTARVVECAVSEDVGTLMPALMDTLSCNDEVDEASARMRLLLALTVTQWLSQTFLQPLRGGRSRVSLLRHLCRAVSKAAQAHTRCAVAPDQAQTTASSRTAWLWIHVHLRTVLSEAEVELGALAEMIDACVCAASAVLSCRGFGTETCVTDDACEVLRESIAWQLSSFHRRNFEGVACLSWVFLRVSEGKAGHEGKNSIDSPHLNDWVDWDNEDENMQDSDEEQRDDVSSPPGSPSSRISASRIQICEHIAGRIQDALEKMQNLWI